MVDPEGDGIDRSVASVLEVLAGETLDDDESIASEVLREALSEGVEKVPARKVRRSEERSDELGIRQLRSKSSCACCSSLGIDATIIATQF